MSNRSIVGGIVLDVWERGLQTFARIVRLGILDGLLIILEFLFGVSPIQCANLAQPPHRVVVSIAPASTERLELISRKCMSLLELILIQER